MQRHCQRVQQAVDQLQATAPLLSLRGLLSLQLITLRCASALLASVHLFTAAAIPLLSCALLHLHSAHLTEALACLVQAEELHQRKATATPTAQVSYQYELLLCEVRLHLRPSSPLPSLPSPLPQSSHVALRLLQCQGLSVESLLRWKEGRGEDSLAARKAECRGWTQLVHHLMGSVRKAETNSTATSGHSREASTKSQRVGSGHSRLEVERREECKEQEGAEADAAHEVQASREYDALLGSLSSVSSPHVHLILSSFLSCLRHYAGLLERCGHIRDALHYLDLALSLSDGLHAERDTLWLRMLQRRIHTKRRQPQGQPSQSDPSQPAEVREERIDTELQLEAASLAAATGEGFEVTIEGSERFAVIARYVEMADAYRRGAQQEAGCQHYRHALTLINQSLQHTSSSSGLTEGRLQLTSDATTKRVVTRRPTRSKAKKPSASRDVVADSNQPPMHPLHLYRAHIDAKIASLSLSASLPHPSPLDCLIRSSSSFAHGNEHVDHAWALYWQWRAAPFNLTRPHPWSSAALRSGETSPSSQLSLLRSAVDACCRLAPPYLTRLLFLALSSATGLTSPLDAAFALNASIGITARHAVNRTLHARPQTTDVDSLTTSLSVLHLGSNSADGQADAMPGEVASRSDALRPLFSFDAGVDADRRRFECDFVGKLPPEWTVVSVALSEDEQQLLVSRLCSPVHGLAPVVLRLPLTSTFTDLQTELSAVLHASGSMNESVKGQSDCSDDVKTEWWAGRFALDARMKAALTAIEEALFGAWRGALTGLHRSEQDRQRLQCAARKVTAMLLLKAESAASGSSSSPLYPYVHALMDNAVRLTDEELDSAMMWLLGWTERQRLSTEEMAELLKAQQGSQVQLLQRVRAEVRVQQLSETDERLPVVLLLSSQLQQLPFESLPILTDVPVTRMPSYLFLLHHLTTPPSRHATPPCMSSHSFILNPSSDLPRTEATFTTLLPALGLTHGLTGVHPSPSTFLTALTCDVFLYLGHGSGDQYIPASLVERSPHPPRVALLMGCSSGRLKGVSREYEGWGMAAALLVGGAQVVVANLWDVTDGEIDRFTVRLMEGMTGRVLEAGRRERGVGGGGEKWGKGGVRGKGGRARGGKGKSGSAVGGEGEVVRAQEVSEVRTVSEVVMRSRSACRLRYLMGASPVVFGIPLTVQRQ